MFFAQIHHLGRDTVHDNGRTVQCNRLLEREQPQKNKKESKLIQSIFQDRKEQMGFSKDQQSCHYAVDQDIFHYQSSLVPFAFPLFCGLISMIT